MCEQCDKDEEGRPTGEFLGKTCFKCTGRGRRLIITERVNPASIKTTVDIGGKYVGDRVYHVIEQTVRQWKETDATRPLSRVVIREYLYNGTQEMKALDLRKSTTWYEKQLHRAHADLEILLRTG